MIGSKGFSQSLWKSVGVFFGAFLFGTNHFFTMSPHCSSPLLLSEVCDGLNRKCISEMWILCCKAWKPMHWAAEAVSIVSAVSFAWGLPWSGSLLWGQERSYRYQERWSAVRLQIGYSGDETLHSSDSSQWLIRMADIFELFTITSHASKCRSLQEQLGTLVAKTSMAKAAIAVSYWQK